MRRVAVALVVWSSLACGGLFVDGAGLKATEAALENASPHMVQRLFVQGGAEAGLVNPLCAPRVAMLANVSAEMKQHMTANVLFQEPVCPRPCADGEPLAPLDPVERTAAAVADCSSEGLDPFGGDLAPLRDHSDALDYLLTRMLAERALSASDSFEPLLEPIAVSMALQGPQRAVVGGSMQVISSRTVDTLQVDGSKLVGCERPVLRHRMVVGPKGKVAGVAGDACGAAVLEQLTFTGDGTWTVIDIAWDQPVL